jgi:hypothetical protein
MQGVLSMFFSKKVSSFRNAFFFFFPDETLLILSEQINLYKPAAADYTLCKFDISLYWRK